MRTEDMVATQCAVLFAGLNRLHTNLHDAGRIEERDEVTAMALRIREIASGKSEPKPENDHDKLSQLTAHDIAKHVAANLSSDFADVCSKSAAVCFMRRNPGQAPLFVVYSMFDARFHGLASNEIADIIRREEAECVK